MVACSSARQPEEAIGHVASAITGDVLAQFSVPSSCDPAGGLAVIPAAVLGIRDATQLLAVSCIDDPTTGASSIAFLNTATGAQVKRLSVSGAAGPDFIALAYRGDRGDLIGLQGAVQTHDHRVYSIAIAQAGEATAHCSDVCSTAKNGVCDDGGDGASSAVTCVYGTDCTDCGSRSAGTADTVGGTSPPGTAVELAMVPKEVFTQPPVGNPPHTPFAPATMGTTGLAWDEKNASFEILTRRATVTTDAQGSTTIAFDKNLVTRIDENGDPSAPDQIGIDDPCFDNTHGASGIVVSGQKMLVACSNRGIGFGSSNPQQTSKLLLEDRQTEQVTELATVPFNTGDLECDPGSFSALGKTAVWGISLEGKVFAIEVPADTCGAAGADPDDRQNLVNPNGQATPELTAVCSTLLGDGDSDGILDCWEQALPGSGVTLAGRAPGIDWDLDGQVDYLFPADELPTMGVKDIYVEVDYMAGHAPNQEALDKVKEAFDVAPPTFEPLDLLKLKPILPRLHIQVDEQALTHKTEITWAATQGPVDVPSYFGVRSTLNSGTQATGFFGTRVERDAPNREKLLKAKAKVYRYALYVHSMRGCNGCSGAADGGNGQSGNDIVISLHGQTAKYPPVPAIPGEPWVDRDFEAKTFMHELGHTLGFNHGGDDAVNYKPNYASVMNYTFQSRRYFSVDLFNSINIDTKGAMLNYSEQLIPALQESALNESLGMQGPSPGLTSIFFRPEPGTRGAQLGECVIDSVPQFACKAWGAPTIGPDDWNANGAIQGVLPPTSINGDAAHTQLTGYNDWQHLAAALNGSPFTQRR